MLTLDDSLVDVLFGSIESASVREPWYPFDQRIMDFLTDLSRQITKDAEARYHPDVLTFGFWCRPSNLASLQERHEQNNTEIGRGVSFHIPPSNVPLNCAYSLTVGLLAGNTCIVRLPTESPELVELLRCLESVRRTGKHASVFARFVLLRYGHNDEITTDLSSLADVRVIWGGDLTIRHIRSLPTKPRCVDVAFADRLSLALIRSELILAISESQLHTVCTRFISDSMTFGQNACSSPRLVVWHGQDGELSAKASSRFWKKIDELLQVSTVQEPINVMDRFAELCAVIANSDAVSEVSALSSATIRVQLKSADSWHESAMLRFGTFTESSVSSLSAVEPLLNEKVQTLTYFGFSPAEIRDWMTERVLSHVDHVVPIGSALDFDLVWDGYPMIHMLTRRVRVR